MGSIQLLFMPSTFATVVVCLLPHLHMAILPRFPFPASMSLFEHLHAISLQVIAPAYPQMTALDEDCPYTASIL